MLEVEPTWYERGVKEAIHIHTLQPTLNKDGGRHNLSNLEQPTADQSQEGGADEFESPAGSHAK